MESIKKTSCSCCNNYDAINSICITVTGGFNVFDPNAERSCALFERGAVATVHKENSPQQTKNSKYINLQIDLIQELRQLTIDNPNFDSDSWCAYDADVLEGAATMIREDILKKQKPQEIERHKRSMMIIF